MFKKMSLMVLASALSVASIGIPITSAYAASSTTHVPDENVVYVSLDGKPGAKGSFADPFPTVEAARDYLAGKTSANKRGIVYIRGGVYRATATIDLQGAKNSYVTYESYQGEDVVFTGTTTLTTDKFHKLSDVVSTDAKWSSASRIQEGVRDKVFVYDLGAENIPVGSLNKNGFNWITQPYPPELVVDDKIQILAQYPNGTGKLNKNELNVKYAPPGARDYFSDKTSDGTTLPYKDMLKLPGPIFTASSPAVKERFLNWAQPTDLSSETSIVQPDRDIDNTKYETDGWFTGYFGNNYGNDRLRIYSVSAEGIGDDGTPAGYNIRTKYPSMYVTTDKWTSFVAQNILNEIDMEGEYYIDRWKGNNVLYYYPTGGSIEDKHITLLSFDKPFFKLEGVTGVTLSGLKLNGTTGNAVEMLDTESSTIDEAEIYNVSMDAVVMGEASDAITAVAEYRTSRGGHNNRVVNSKLHDLGGGGVFAAGGDRKTLERGNHIVEHNEIYNFSRLATYTPAGYMYGVGNTFRYNNVHDAPHMAIQIMGNDMVITHNRFDNMDTNASDQGVIYSGRDYTYLNNEISYNYFSRVKGNNNQAVYMDDGVSGLVIHHNFFNEARFGLFYNSGHSNIAHDNVFYNVGNIGKDKLYHSTGEKLPVANSKVVSQRFNDMLMVGDGSGFSNTAENVNKWYEHYESQYPNIRQWYLPANGNGTLCTQVDTAACTRDNIWVNPNSVYVPANNVLTRSVQINSGGFAYTSGTNLKTFNADFDAFNISNTDPSYFSFDPATAKFDERSSILNTTEGFGADWVKHWNEHFTIDHFGPLTIRITSLEQLVNQFQANGSIDNQGIANSLLKKLQNNDLQSFINELIAQSGKHVSIEAAADMLRDAEYLLK